MIKRKYLWLILIFFFGLLFRLVGLGDHPPSLNWDEASHGYNAYSILKTGSDEWGQFLPIANFRAYGDYPLPLYMYLAMPGILLLGLGEFAIRLPSAIFGSFMIIVAFLLTQQIFKKINLSWLAALLIAISPWGLMISRQVLQATPAILFLALGIWLFWEGLKGKYLLTFLGTISLGLSAYGYHNTRILAPIIFIILVWLSRNIFQKQKTLLIKLLIVAGIFFIPLIPVVFFGQGDARATWVSIVDQGAINQINEERGSSQLPPVFSKLIYNKQIYFARVSLLNYLSYFSPQYLGFEGGTQYQYSVPNFGEMYPIELPFFYLGLILLIAKFNKSEMEKRFLLIWLLLSPLPAAVTRDPFQVVRSTTMLPVIFLVAVYGFGHFLEIIKVEKVRKIILAFFGVVLMVLFLRYAYNYMFIYPKNYSFAWQYGYKQVAEYVQNFGDKYSQIIITKKYGEPHEFLLFYTKYDPSLYKNDTNLVRYQQSNWFWVDSFSKFKFINDWEIQTKATGTKNTLLITSPGNYPKNGKLLETIDFLDGEPAFDIVEL